MHMQKEELILFPALRKGRGPRLANPIAAMIAEHDDHGVHLRELQRLTGSFTPPEGACATWRALYTGLDKFADDLVDHIHTENNVLFPRFTAWARSTHYKRNQDEGFDAGSRQQSTGAQREAITRT